MLSYGVWMLIGSIVCAGCAFLLDKKKDGRAKRCIFSLCLSALLCPVCSKLFYCVTQLHFVIADGLIPSLTNMAPNTWSFFGGAAGICLAVFLAAKCLREDCSRVLDTYAPALLLMAAMARFGCYFLQKNMVGWGDYLEEGWYSFFPLCMVNDWGESYLAVFMIEALSALILTVVSLTVFKKQRFLRSLCWLCLMQILCESLHGESISWLFVRVEQLFSMIVLEAVLCLYACKTPGKSFLRRFLSPLIGLICALLFVGVEFALDKSSWPVSAIYAVMVCGLAVLGYAEHIGFCRAVFDSQSEI